MKYIVLCFTEGSVFWNWSCKLTDKPTCVTSQKYTLIDIPTSKNVFSGGNICKNVRNSINSIFLN